MKKVAHRGKYVVSALAFVCIFLCGCQSAKNQAAREVFSQNDCGKCHSFHFETGQFVSKDWYFAHFWDPLMVVSSSNMPRYEDQFSIIPATISDKAMMTPSGDSVYPIAPNDVLKTLFTFENEPMIYVYISNVSSKDLPEGYKAFISGTKMKGRPVAWIPPLLRGSFHPPAQITLISPRKNLQILTDYAVSLPHQAHPAWLAMPDSPTEPLPPGKPLYEAHCALCHGELGDGNGPASVFLYPKPRNFRSGEFKLKSTLNSPLATDSDVYRTITHGMPGTAMPSWSALSPGERWALVEYVKSFATTAAKAQAAPGTISEPKLAYRSTADRIATGERLFFTKAKCNDCHGPSPKSLDGLPHGDGPSSGVLVDDWGYPIHPADLAGGALKRGNSIDDVYITITAGMPGTPMPPYQNNLSDEERWDIAAYVSSLNIAHSALTVRSLAKPSASDSFGSLTYSKGHHGR